MLQDLEPTIKLPDADGLPRSKVELFAGDFYRSPARARPESLDLRGTDVGGVRGRGCAQRERLPRTA